jgi:hypothetical protein
MCILDTKNVALNHLNMPVYQTKLLHMYSQLCRQQNEDLEEVCYKML